MGTPEAIWIAVLLQSARALRLQSAHRDESDCNRTARRISARMPLLADCNMECYRTAIKTQQATGLEPRSSGSRSARKKREPAARLELLSPSSPSRCSICCAISSHEYWLCYMRYSYHACRSNFIFFFNYASILVHFFASGNKLRLAINAL
jgi:hypothetical protein